MQSNILHWCFCYLFTAVRCDQPRSTAVLPHISHDVIILADLSQPLNISWLQQLVPMLNSKMEYLGSGIDTSCTNLFAFIGFGGQDPVLYSATTGDYFFTNEYFTDIISQVNTSEPNNASDGYQAMSHALDTLPQRLTTRGCLVHRHMLLVVNDGNTQSSIDQNKLFQRLNDSDINLHVVANTQFVVDGTVGVGRERLLGYRVNTDKKTCFQTSQTVTMGLPHSEVNAQKAFGLDLGGTAWNIDELRNTDSRKALTCAMLQEFQQQVSTGVGSCFNCTCDDQGMERCTIDSAVQSCNFIRKVSATF